MSSTSSLNSLLSSASASTSSSGVDLTSILTAATGSTSSGIDVSSAVDGAIYAARAPERQWQSQQSVAQAQSTTLSSIQTTVASVVSDLQTLADPLGSVTSKLVTSANPDVLSATASNTAAVGHHAISVEQVASPAGWYSSPVPNAASALGSSSLQIVTSDGNTHSYALGSGGSASLSALASAINAGAFGVSASVVTDSSGSRLALLSQRTGRETNFTVTEISTASPAWNSAILASGASLAAGSFTVGEGSSSQTISVSAGDTLSTVADRINASGLALSASVVADASGSHLAVRSTGGSVSVSSDPAFTLTQSSIGQDAELHVDGVPVTSSINSINGVIAGVTLNVQGTTDGKPLSVDVTADTTTISTALSQFVQDYNAAIKIVNGQFSFSTTSTAQGQLGSNSDVRALQSALLGITSFAGGSGANGASLSSIGITMNDDGSLSLDESALTAALAKNPASVQQLMQGSAQDGFAAVSRSALDTFSNPAYGLLTKASATLGQQVTNLQSQINDYESGYVASQLTLLTSMYSKAEIALQQLPATLKQIQAQLGNNSGS